MEDFGSIYKEVCSIFLVLKKSSSVQISSPSLKSRTKKLVFAYFNELRAKLFFDVQEIDGKMQELMTLTNKNASRTSYLKLINSLKKLFESIELQVEMAKNSPKEKDLMDSPLDLLIIKTLESIHYPASIAYKQSIEDLKIPRISYRGTSAELREVLRETLDKLAPDDEIKKSHIKPENGNNYTMRQRVRFVLKNRGISDNRIETPENSASIIDDGIARVARATYNRGSQSTHSESSEKQEVLLLKRYLDNILCELLEIPLSGIG